MKANGRNKEFQIESTVSFSDGCKFITEAIANRQKLIMRMSWFGFPQRSDAQVCPVMHTSLHAHANLMLASSSSRRRSLVIGQVIRREIIPYCSASRLLVPMVPYNRNKSRGCGRESDKLHSFPFLDCGLCLFKAPADSYRLASTAISTV